MISVEALTRGLGFGAHRFENENRTGEKRVNSNHKQHSAAFESVYKFLSRKTQNLTKLKAAANLFVHITLKPLSCEKMKANQNWLYVVAMGTYLLANTYTLSHKHAATCLSNKNS